MKEIVKKNWEYVLYENDRGELIFSVLVGTVYQYSLNIQLNQKEKEAFEREGTVFLDKLAEDIVYDPEKYKFRDIQGFKI